MPDDVVIVDYQLGNLYNVLRVCQRAGLGARISSSPEDVAAAAAVILPGVGAFGDAMSFLRDSGLAEALKWFASAGKPLLGICLGMQLLMSESHEFGRHQGLGIVPGPVVRFATIGVKVPHVGWNRVHLSAAPDRYPWQGTLLAGLEDGEYMYFVHSYYAAPEDRSVVLSVTRYGDTEFCSSLQYGNVFGCQFHPERSGPQGVGIYDRLAEQLRNAARLRQTGTLPHVSAARRAAP